ncbi:MAG: TonB-dependent receptor [Saprospiraceae bacterium]
MRLSIIPVFLLYGSLLAAQSTDSVQVNLEEIVISSSYEALDNAPFAYQNLTTAQIEAQNAGQEPAYILASTPAITVYSDAGNMQGYTYFRLRGIDLTRLAMTLDGVPLNEPEDQGVYFSNYPDFFNSVSRIHIQRGVGTSKNGTSGFGGSIQFTSPNLHAPRSLQAGIGFGSFNTQRAFAEFNTGINKGVGAYIRASHLHSDGFKNRSAHTGQSIFYSFGLYGNKHVFKWTGFVGRQQNEMAWLGVPASILQQNPRANANAQEDDAFTQRLFQIQHSWAINSNTTLKSSVFHNYLQGEYDFDLNNFLDIPTPGDIYTYRLRSHFGGIFSNLEKTWRNGQLTVGVFANRYARQHLGYEQQLGRLYRNRGYRTIAGTFVKVAQQWGKWEAMADLQYRYSDFNYRGSVRFEPIRWHFFNPKVGIQYPINNHLDAWYSVGTNGREPTRNDMFGGNDDLLEDENGQALLFITQPEYVTDHEAGIRWQGKRAFLNTNLYFMRFRNEIILNGQFGPNGLALSSDVDRSFRTGLEAEGGFSPNATWRFSGNAAFNFCRIQQADVTFEPILTPLLTANHESTWQQGRWTIALHLRYQSASWIDFANENRIPGFVLVNTRMGCTLGKWEAKIFLNNLTNTSAYTNGYVDFNGTNRYFVQSPTSVMAQVVRHFY